MTREFIEQSLFGLTVKRGFHPGRGNMATQQTKQIIPSSTNKKQKEEIVGSGFEFSKPILSDEIPLTRLPCHLQENQ